MQLKEDLQFAGRYKLLKLLGRGGFSEVWLATDEWTKLDVAVKVYAPGQGMDEDGLKDFCKELSNVYNLNHTNLLKPQHVDTREGMPYLVMAYCEKGSCYGQVGKFTEKEAWKLIGDVASGLAYLHAQDIIHQDIKPDNILIDNNGNYVITDFGISVQTRSTLRKSARQASTGGTTAYMAPERFAKDAAPVKASDIWSLGATVYELVTGRMPFGEVGGGMQRGGADIPTINARITPALRQTIARMLAEDPWDRPTASLLADWAQNPAAIELVSEDEIGGDGGSSFLKVTPAKIEANPAGGEAKLVVKADKNWRCFAEQQKWCTVEKIDHESLVIKYKPNQSGEARKTSVNIVAGPRAATVSVSQVSLPKPKTALIVAIVAVVLALGAFGAWKLGNSNAAPNLTEELQIVKINYEKTIREFDIKNRHINDKNDVANPGNVITALEKLQDIERMESNQKFDKLKIIRVFSDKLKAYRDNLLQASNYIQEDLDVLRQELEESSNTNYEDDEYFKKMNSRKRLVDRILEQSKKGSVKDIILEKPKE